ncbi:MAG: formyltransferase family protein [Acetatifactor sp.]|nr:formyltransferase family protein [Acetatifactor sp.]
MIRELEPAFIISYNYRHIIKEDVIEAMKGRIINLHTSYLPYNRGASPNVFSFLENTRKGVTIHVLDKGLDTGDILCQKELFFDESKETFASSYERLLEEMNQLFRENWKAIRAGKIVPRRQEGEGSYHTMKDLQAIREKKPFTWDTVIQEYKSL